MLIHALKLAGYRSVAPATPVDLADLGHVNLLIGANNVGKSNVGRFLVRVRELLVNFREALPWGDGVTWHAPMNIPVAAADEVDHWLPEDVPIEAELALAAGAIESPSPLASFLLTDGMVRVLVRITRTGVNGVLSVVPLSSTGLPVIKEESGTPKLLGEDGSYTEPSGTEPAHRGLALAVCRCLARSILEIRALRDPARSPVNQRAGSTDGGDILSALRSAQVNQNEQASWTACKRDIRTWLQVLLGEKDIRFEINDSGFWVELTRGEGEFRCLLQDLGSGVAEILMMLAYLRLQPRGRFFVVIDEPEAHLHPGAVVELARIMATGFPSHQLLVTTHSTALVDAVTPTWRTFRVSRGSKGSTLVESLNTAQGQLGLLADLGIRPSQLFLAKVAIWVEGPSDVHYLTSLLRAVAPSLVSGRDFAFVTYGGASGSHLRFGTGAEDDGDVEALVEVLTVSHRAVIFCDRDRAEGEDDRDLVKLLVGAAARRGGHARVEISAGREMENAVMPEVLARVLAEVRPGHLGRGEAVVRLQYRNYTINSGDEFNVAVAQAAERDGGGALTDPQRKRVRELLDARKCRIAARVRELSSAEPVFRSEALTRATALADWLSTDPRSEG